MDIKTKASGCLGATGLDIMILPHSLERHAPKFWVSQ